MLAIGAVGAIGYGGPAAPCERAAATSTANTSTPIVAPKLHFVKTSRPMFARARRIVPAVLAATAVAATAVGATATASAHKRRPIKLPRGECAVPGRNRAIDQLWRPDMAAATAYAHARVGDIAFAVRTQDRFYGYRPYHQEWSASVLKAMLMVAYLDMPSVANRPIDASDNSLLIPMIEVSDNNAADQVDTIVGAAGLDALARRVGMTQFVPAEPIWGESEITPRDQTLFFLHIDSAIAPRHRAYGMHLLANVTPSERWGIGEVGPPGWTLYFKGGWGSGTGLMDHQVVLIKRGCARVSIAVETMNDGSHPYGKDTLRGIFARLLERFPRFPRR
jgi:beta-lactamase class A